MHIVTAVPLCVL